jgi:hypothetical protein
MTSLTPLCQHDRVLTGVKAKPSGWPLARLDTGSGPGRPAVSGASHIHKNQASTVHSKMTLRRPARG